MVLAKEDDLSRNLIHFKTQLAAFGDAKLVENMKEVDKRCKEIESPEYEDVQLKFILELFDQTEDFDWEDFFDEGKDDKKDESDNSDHDDSDVDAKPKIDDEYFEELETS